MLAPIHFETCRYDRQTRSETILLRAVLIVFFPAAIMITPNQDKQTK
jgi:hypothetical protein